MPTDIPDNRGEAPEPPELQRATPGRPGRPAQHDGGSFLVAVVSGIPIRIHVTFLLLLAFIGLPFLANRNESPAAVLLILALFFCVILHELGHALVARRYGIRTLSITLYPIGGVAALEELPRPRQELWIALAGPAVNVVIAVAIWSGLALSHRLPPISFNIEPSRSFFANLMVANLLLAAFNMLPAFPMDGGRVLRAIIARFTDEVTATTVAALIGKGMAVLIGLFGLATGQFITLIIAVFIWFGAGQEAAYFQTRALLVGHRVREAMLREFHTLPVGSTLRQAADLLLASSQQDFPILNGTDIVGVLSRSALLQGMASQGPDTYVTSVMDREFASARPDDALEGLLTPRLAGPILVLSDGLPIDSSLIGMITQENLLEFLTLSQLQNRIQGR
ncbi:MAG TPA: site-2 protease family protein [Chthonomonadaceae bacterium]|nr:site-2 protease family protein [Chthonomonadaceae bacterium]